MQEATPAIDEGTLLAQMGWVRDLARHLVTDPGLAEDVAQEAWLAAHRSAPAEVQSEGQLRAWLSVVVRNLVRRSKRSAGRREGREALAARDEALESTAELVARGAQVRDLTQLVMQLDEPYRAAILLRYLDGLSTAEVAERQGVSPVAARKRLSRGLEQLRARLDARHDGDREAWCMALLPLILSKPAAKVAVGSALGSLTGVLALNTKLITALVLAVIAAFLYLDPLNDAEQPDRDGLALLPGSSLEAQPAGQGADGGAAPGGGQRTSLPADGVRIELFDASGQPLVETWVGQLLDGQLVARARTDAEGACALPQLEPGAELLVVPRRATAERFRLDENIGTDSASAIGPGSSPGSLRLQLSPGARLAGTLSGSAAPGTAGISGTRALVLEHDRPLAVFDGLAPELLAELADEGVAPDRQELAVDPDGSFYCSGLAAAWTGALLAPRGFRIAPEANPGDLLEGRELLLLAPATDVQLPLVRLVRVGGRLVQRGTGLAAPGVWLDGRLAGASRTPREPLRALTDGEGRFELVLPLPAGADLDWNLELEASAADARGGPWAFAGAELGADGDLGALRVDPGESLAYLVLGPDGAPLAGAVGHVPALGLHGQPTDAAGRGQLGGLRDLGASSVELVVTKLGYATAKVAASTDALAQVRLAPASSLVVRVRDVDGEVPDDLRVQVLGDELSWEAPFGTGWLELGPDADPAAARAGRAQLEAPLGLDAEGRLELGPLRAGLALEVRLLSASGEVLDSRRVLSPGAPGAAGAGSLLEVPFVVPRTGFVIAGLVRDPEGRALPRASIYAEARDGAREVRTDADGRFELGPFHGPSKLSYLQASRPGYGLVQLEDVRLEPGGPALELTLQPARRLAVQLEDSLGQRPRVPYLEAELSDGSQHAGLFDAETGDYLFAALPKLSGEVRVELAGSLVAVEVDGLQTSARLEVPAMGKLAAKLAPSLELREGARVCLVWQRVEAGEVIAEGRSYFPRQGADGEPLELDLPPGSYRVQLEQRVLARRLVERLGEVRDLELGAGEVKALSLP